MHKPTIGVIGLGSIGKRHYANFEELGCRVLGYDPESHSPRDEYHAMRKASDAVVIAAPTSTHKWYMSIGKPMLMEKPIVATREEWKLADTTNVLMVGYNLRFHSCVRKVRSWLADGQIGKPIWARFTCAQHNAKPDYLRDGVLLNWSHEIDLALYLLGTATYKGSAIHNDPEDMADIFLRHNNSMCRTTIHLDYLTMPERRGFVIVGDGGSIDADLVSRQAFLKDREGKLIHCHFGRDTWNGNYLHEAQSFLALLEGKIDPKNVIGCTAKEALDVVDICLSAKEDNRYE